MDEILRNKLLHSFPNTVFVDVVQEYNSGRSGMPVFVAEFRSRDSSGLDGTYVVKIGPRAWAITEEKLYSNRAITPLTSFLAPFQNSSKTVSGFKALAYDVAFNELISTRTLTSLVDRGGKSAYEALQQIKRLSHALVSWNIDDASRNRKVFDSYALLCLMLGRRMKGMQQKFNMYLPFWNQETPHIRIDGLPRLLPNPLMYLKEEAWRRIQTKWTCPIGHIHGDLHTGNIICLPGTDENPKVIDFGQFKSDRVPFFDLAYLEFDIIQHVLPVEQEEYRKQWLYLLDFSMASILPTDQPLGYQADRTWMLIRPIREQVERLQQVNNQRHQRAYEMVWWITTVAVGLNFANKGDAARPLLERISGLLYASYGLERFLEILEADLLDEEHSPLIAWIRGETIQTPLLTEKPSTEPQLDLHREDLTEVPLLTEKPSTEPQLDLHREDLTEAPYIEQFYGRDWEIANLKRWIIDDHCRVVVILGIGGIGKTTLAATLIERLKDNFNYVFWRKIQDAPPLQSILEKAILFFSSQKQIDLPKDVDDQISLLIKYLQNHRCLLVLDNIETILQDNSKNQGQDGNEGYRKLIQRIAEGKHQSCLLLTSREKPKEVILLEGNTSPVRSLQLLGLGQAEGQKILKDKGLFGSGEAWEILIHLYSGNPLALKLVSEPVRTIFGGNISLFLKEGEIVVGGIQDLLNQQFKHLSELEQEIMFWLAIEREAVSLENLQEDIVYRVPKRTLLGGLESLRRRSMIEIDGRAYFMLQPVILEYVTNRLVEQMIEDIEAEAIEFLARYAVIKAQAKDYVRESQVRLILIPLVMQLLAILGREGTEQKLRNMLFKLHQIHHYTPDYVAGNILNLMIQSQCNLRALDFSHLSIRQAYLQGKVLPDINFTYANLVTSVFTETFGSIQSVALSPKGERLAAGTMNGEIRLWQVPNCTPLLTRQGHSGWIISIAFSPDGSMLASGSGDQTIRLWEVSTGDCLKTLHGHASWVRSVAFSPDGGTLASSSEDQTVRLWEVSTGHCLKTLQGHAGWVRSVVFSPDGNMLASGSDDQTIRLWEVSTGNCLKTLQGHTSWIWSVAFSPDGNLLASGSSDQTVRLWEVSTGNCLKTLQGHTSWISSITFSPDRRTLVSGSDDQTVRLWEVSTGDCLKTLQEHTNRIWSIALSHDGSMLASGSDDQTVRLWEVSTGRCLKTLQGYANWVWFVASSPDGSLLASSSEDQTVRLWEVSTGRCLKTLQGHKNRVRSISFSPDGNLLASCSHDQTVRLWEVSTGDCLKTLYGHTTRVWSIAFNPDGSMLASAGEDQIVRLWEVSTGRCLKTFHGHTNWVRSVTFSLDGSMLASAAGDHTVRLWEVSTGDCLKTLHGHTDWVYSAVFSPDGSMLASGSEDRTVRLWEVSTGDCLKTLQGHTSWIWSVAFSPDGNLFASGSDDQTVRLWEVSTGNCLKTLQGHTKEVRSVTFVSGSHTLASGSNDETIKLWNVQTGECLKTLLIDKPYERMNITNAIGLTEAQKTSLKALGAIEEVGDEFL